MATLKVVYFF